MKLYRNPLRNISKKRSTVSASSPQPNGDDALRPPSSESLGKRETGTKKSYDPYGYMSTALNAPPVPGKKAEKYQFDMSLLFKDGQEFSVQEARAASLGLLGKKWGPPPKSEPGPHQGHGVKQTAISLKEEGTKQSTRTNHMRMNMNMTAQLADGPTVTLNTKEALKDVYGMYNSPDRTTKTGNLAVGTKFAPVKKFESLTPSQPQQALKRIAEHDDEENAQARPRCTDSFDNHYLTY